MKREFTNSRLVLGTLNPLTDKKSRISLNNLTEDAPGDAVQAIRDTLDQLTEDSVENVSAVVTYEYLSLIHI